MFITHGKKTQHRITKTKKRALMIDLFGQHHANNIDFWPDDGLSLPVPLFLVL